MKHIFLTVAVSLAYWKGDASDCKSHVRRNFTQGTKTLLLTEENSTCYRNDFIFDNMFGEEHDVVEIYYECAQRLGWFGWGKAVTLPQGKQVCTDRWYNAESTGCFAYIRSSPYRCSWSLKCPPVRLDRHEQIQITTRKASYRNFTIWYKLTNCKDYDYDPLYNNKEENVTSTRWCRDIFGFRLPSTQWKSKTIQFPYNCAKTRECSGELVQETTGRCEQDCSQIFTKIGGQYSCEDRCICPREKYRNAYGMCVRMEDCRVLPDTHKVRVTTPATIQKTPPKQNHSNKSTTDIAMGVGAFAFIFVMFFGLGCGCSRRQRPVSDAQDSDHSEITFYTISPYAETAITTPHHSQPPKSIQQVEMTSPYRGTYIEPETLPSNSASDIKHQYTNPPSSPSISSPHYSQIERTEIDTGYMRPIARQSVEEAPEYHLPTIECVNDNSYLEINLESKA